MGDWVAGERGAAPGEVVGWDGFVRTEIGRYLARYAALQVAVGSHDTGETIHAQVHVPYMMGTVAWIDQPDILARQRPRHQARLRRVRQAREAAPPEVQAFFQRWFYDEGGEARLVAAGRSSAAGIRQLLQAAVDGGLVPLSVGSDRLTGSDLRAWLRRYGIGVDCSAFVQHTLTFLLEASYAAVEETPASRQVTDVGWMRAASVHRELVQEAADRRFDLVATPARSRPGDILVSKGHSRIVIDAERTGDGALVVTLAESTSRTDLVAGTSFEADVGPRRYHVRYPAPDHGIADQVPDHKRASEAVFEFEPSEWEQQFLLARNRRLAAFQQRHQTLQRP